MAAGGSILADTQLPPKMLSVCEVIDKKYSEHLPLLVDISDATGAWLKEAFAKAQAIFLSSKVPAFPETPRVKRKRRTKLSILENKENVSKTTSQNTNVDKKNNSNSEDAFTKGELKFDESDDSSQRKTRFSKRMAKQEMVPLQSERLEVEDTPQRMTRSSFRRHTRSRNKHLAATVNDNVMPPPQTVVVPKLKLRNTRNNSTVPNGDNSKSVDSADSDDSKRNLKTVQLKVRAYEAQIKSSEKSALTPSPTRAMAVGPSPVKDAKLQTKPRSYVSTLSPVVLVDMKLSMSPRVVLSPLTNLVSLSSSSSQQTSESDDQQPLNRQKPKINRRSVRHSVRHSSISGRLSLNSNGRRKSKLLTAGNHIIPKRSSLTRRSLAAAAKKISGEGMIDSEHLTTPPNQSGSNAEAVKISTATVTKIGKSDFISKTPVERERFDSNSCSSAGSDNVVDEVIPKTPSPVCPSNKVVRPVSALMRSGQSRRPFTRARTVKRSGELRKTNRPSSISKVQMSSAQKLTSVKRVFTPQSAKRTVQCSPKIRDSIELAKRREEMLLKEERERQILARRQQKIKMKIEEQKLRREARMKRVNEQRRVNEEQAIKERLEKEQEMKNMLKEREEKLRIETQKRGVRHKQKMVEAEERRAQEEDVRQQKLKEQEEEQRRYEQMLQRKKEEEEARRQKLVQKKLVEVEQKRLQDLEAKRLKELEQQNQENALRRAKELDKQQEMKRIAREKAELERIQEREAAQLKDVQTSMNTTYCKDELNETKTLPGKELNSTFNLESQNSTQKQPNPECYEITPERSLLKPLPLRDPDNYDITNLHSDDPTDEESNPRKFIPKWAQGQQLRAKLIFQLSKPPDLDKLFPFFEPPDLLGIFKKKRSRFLKRTSSAIWSSPVLSHLSPGYNST